MSKLERLLNLTAVLLDTLRPLSAKELRVVVEGYPESDQAFHRAFERDKDDLRALGIPLVKEHVPATDPPVYGYRIHPSEYYLPDPGLTAAELAALHFATLAVRIEGVSHSEAIWKLGGAKQPSLTEALKETKTETLTSVQVDTTLVSLFEAVTKKFPISFLYKGSDRVVDPWRLDFRRGRWYLTGYEHKKCGERKYRLDRIESKIVRREGEIKVHNVSDSEKAGTLPAWLYGDDVQDAEIWVSADRSDVVQKQLAAHASVTVNDDGSLHCVVPVSNFEPFRSFLLGYLDHVELLAPSEWRQELVEWLQKIEGSYA